MYAFNRRFDPSRMLFLPPMCFLGALLVFIGILLACILSLPMAALGIVMIAGGVFMTVFAWRFRHDTHFIKTYAENRKDQQAKIFGEGL